jgi:replication factor C subunit 1
MMNARGPDAAKLDAADGKREAERAKKTSIKVGPFDVVRKVFSASEQREMSIYDKSDLFFHDYSLGPLFTQENYLSCKPTAAEE